MDHAAVHHALAVANGDGWLLTTFAGVEPGSVGVLDVDLIRPAANAWVVERDERGAWKEWRIELDRATDGTWTSGSSSGGSWDGWPEIAEPRPPHEWTGWGPVIGLVYETASGSAPSRTAASVRGLAAADVVAIELDVAGKVRRRAVESPTGAFIVGVPATGWVGNRSLRMRAVHADGRTTELDA